MDRLDYRIRRGRQEAVDEMRARDWLRLGAPIALELSPEPAEGEQRSVVVQREPNDVLLFRFRVSRRPHEPPAAARYRPRNPRSLLPMR